MGRTKGALGKKTIAKMQGMKSVAGDILKEFKGESAEESIDDFYATEKPKTKVKALVVEKYVEEPTAESHEEYEDGEEIEVVRQMLEMARNTPKPVRKKNDILDLGTPVSFEIGGEPISGFYCGASEYHKGQHIIKSISPRLLCVIGKDAFEKIVE